MRFEDALRLAGLMPPAYIIPDGKWRRCPTEDKPKKRNGAYVLHPDGKGFYRNWALDEGVSAWTDGDTTRIAKPIDHARIAALKERERAYRIQSTQRAREFWGSAEPLKAIHPYIDGKGLAAHGCSNLRCQDGLLVIPVIRRGQVISVQTIAPDGEKRFWPGASVQGGSYTLSRPKAAITVLAEGFATGLAVFQAVQTARVIVCFDSGNLIHVAQELRPSGMLVIAADNDHQTQVKRGFNPGIKAATNAAELLGAGVSYPTGIEGSDWADYLKEVGTGAARKLERALLANAKYAVSEVA